MENTWNWNDATVDYALLEKVNPVFNTAKMTLYQLAANGDADAATLAKHMGLTLDATQNSATTKASPEQVLGGTIMLEIRYRTMARLAEESGYTLVDLPCGYTPRAIEFAKKGWPYYGLDLPAVIQEASENITALIPPERRPLAHFRAVDATNCASLEKALEDIDGPVCVNTEGLLMYFTDSEAGALCDNIRRILEKKGGCWYMADVECSLQYIIVMRALAGDRFMEIMKNASQQVKDKSDVEIGRNALIASPADMAGSIKNAMAFLAKHGLKAERVVVAEHMPKLDSLDKVSAEQADAVREGMKSSAFWRIIPSGATVALPVSETEGFQVNASIQDGTLSLALTGRLDTITAPSLLSFYEKTKSEQMVDAVRVDCSHLDYISSAGLRVLLIIHKACKGGVSLHGENEVVSEIMCQTGFDSIFH
jgi:Anti-anti-sigma regulatory factor (antagonist of anti-sigma factor)